MGKVLRPLGNVSKARRVADPLAQLSAAGLMSEGLSGLGIGNKGMYNRNSVLQARGGRGAAQLSLSRLMRKFIDQGMTPYEARMAALRWIYANNLSRKTL